MIEFYHPSFEVLRFLTFLGAVCCTQRLRTLDITRCIIKHFLEPTQIICGLKQLDYLTCYSFTLQTFPLYQLHVLLINVNGLFLLPYYTDLLLQLLYVFILCYNSLFICGIYCHRVFVTINGLIWFSWLMFHETPHHLMVLIIGKTDWWVFIWCGIVRKFSNMSGLKYFGS